MSKWLFLPFYMATQGQQTRLSKTSPFGCEMYCRRRVVVGRALDTELWRVTELEEQGEVWGANTESGLF